MDFATGGPFRRCSNCGFHFCSLGVGVAGSPGRRSHRRCDKHCQPLYRGDPTAPITRAEVHEIIGQARTAVPRTVSAITLFFTLSILLVLFGEIVLLTQAGMMYVQTRRIEEQNILLSRQSEVQTAQFLQESLTSVDQIGKSVEDVRRAVQTLNEDFIAPFVIIPDTVNEISAATFGEGEVIRVCFEDDPCPYISAETFANLASTGEIVVTASNAGSLRGWYRFTDVLEAVGLVFTASITNSDVANDDIRLAQDQLSNAIVTCGGTPEGKTVNRFSGLMGGFLAAIDMWPINGPEDIQPGQTLTFPKQVDRANFLGISAAVGLLAESEGSSIEMIGNASDAAALLASSLSMLELEFQELSTSCSSRLQGLSATAEALQNRTNSILETVARSVED